MTNLRICYASCFSGETPRSDLCAFAAERLLKRAPIAPTAWIWRAPESDHHRRHEFQHDLSQSSSRVQARPAL